MKRFLPFLAAFVLASHTGGSVYASPKTIKTKNFLRRIKKDIYEEFSRTHLRSRIVEIKIINLMGKPKVHIMWHPAQAQDIARDTFVIVQVIDKVVPNFNSINLKAINPDRMRWTKQIFWNETIKRENLIFVVPEKDGNSARPLFY